MSNTFFESWEQLLRTGLTTVLAYLLLVVLLRSFGKRTLSKMNAFDFIVTVALGSCLATVSLSNSVPLADGVLVFFLLIGLQFAITWLSARSKKVKSLITSTPALLLYKGELLHEVMKKERVTAEEIYAKAREQGHASVSELEAVVLETTGDITIIAAIGPPHKDEAMETVRHYPQPGNPPSE